MLQFETVNDSDWVVCPRCNGARVLQLRQASGAFAPADCAVCQAEGVIPAWYQLQRFQGIRYRRQRLAAQQTLEQRAAQWSCPVDMVRDLEAGLIRPPFFAPLDPVVVTVRQHNLERLMDRYVDPGALRRDR